MMKVGGFGKVQEGLQDAVNMRRSEEVFTPGDVGDFLGGVIDYDGEVVGGADVFAGEDDVSE